MQVNALFVFAAMFASAGMTYGLTKIKVWTYLWPIERMPLYLLTAAAAICAVWSQL